MPPPFVNFWLGSREIRLSVPRRFILSWQRSCLVSRARGFDSSNRHQFCVSSNALCSRNCTKPSMRSWRNRQTRCAQTAVSQDVGVQVTPSAPRPPRPQKPRAARPIVAGRGHPFAVMAELADAAGLNPAGETRAGSCPADRTMRPTAKLPKAPVLHTHRPRIVPVQVNQSTRTPNEHRAQTWLRMCDRSSDRPGLLILLARERRIVGASPTTSSIKA